MIAEIRAYWHRDLAFFGVIGACLEWIDHVEHREISEVAFVSLVSALFAWNLLYVACRRVF